MADDTVGGFFDLLTARPGSKKAARYGRFAVPGEAKLDLPKGRIRIYYDEAIDVRSDSSTFDAPADLEVTVADAEIGSSVPIRVKPRDQISSSGRRDLARTYVGRVELPRAGRYLIKVVVAEASTHDPHVSLG